MLHVIELTYMQGRSNVQKRCGDNRQKIPNNRLYPGPNPPNQKPSPSPPPPYKHASILENITCLLSLRQNLDTEHTN